MELPFLEDCLGCPLPRCQKGCPLGNGIRDIISFVKQGKETEAATLLHQSNPFPELTSLLCDHQRQCRGNCIRHIKGSGVDFPSLEYAISQSYPYPLGRKPLNGKKIACIGAGIANLTVALILAKGGYEVEVYEKEGFIGGAILTGIPSFRFDKSVLVEIKKRLDSLGVIFHLNTDVDEASFEKIKRTHDHTFLGVGAEKENTAGMTLSGDIIGGLKFLYSLNVENKEQDYIRYKKACVWGGGNVAIDCARSLKRIIDDVSIIYRRGEKEMPASIDEVEEAKKEGIGFNLLCNVKNANIQDGRLKSLTLVNMELGAPDESGRASFKEIENSEFESPCDLLILAIGEKPDLSKFGNVDGVTLVGDCAYGAANVARAIRSGLDEARAFIEKN